MPLTFEEYPLLALTEFGEKWQDVTHEREVRTEDCRPREQPVTPPEQRRIHEIHRLELG
jgi:hypothetical protein